METAIVLSGFGGQGILFAGQVLAQAGLNDGRDVSWLPSYGPEMRGGTASCTVIVSDSQIGSPIADAADVVIALNPPSMAKFERLVTPGGVLVLNESLIEAGTTRGDIDLIRIACSAIALEAGDDRVVSIAALGAAIASRPIVSLPAAMAAIELVTAKAGAEAISRNERGFIAGFLAGCGAAEASAA